MHFFFPERGLLQILTVVQAVEPQVSNNHLPPGQAIHVAHLYVIVRVACLEYEI